MSVVDWLQIVVPSGVMVLAAVLVHMASRRADATQKASIDVELRKIEDDLRNQCVVELHRQKMAAYLKLMDALSKLFTLLCDPYGHGLNPLNEAVITSRYELNEAAMRGSIFFAPQVISGY